MSCVRYKIMLLFCYLKKIYQLISLCYIIKEDFGKISVSVNVTHPWALFWYSPGGGGQKFPWKPWTVCITHPYARITIGTSQPCSKYANRYTIRFWVFTVITTCYLKNGVHIFQAHYMQFRQCSYASAQMCWHKENHYKYHCMVKNSHYISLSISLVKMFKEKLRSLVRSIFCHMHYKLFLREYAEHIISASCKEGFNK